MPYFHHVHRVFGKRLTPAGVTNIVHSKAQALQHENGRICFGYHDKSPFNLNETKLLAMHLPVKQTDPDAECTPVKLGFYRVTSPGVIDEEFVEIGSTTTWCWQQGCMLQWDPAEQNHRIYFNDLVDGVYGSRRLDLRTGQVERQFSFPIYAISNDGREALSLNFSRLGRLRPGYGYDLIDDPFADDASPADDGLYLYDLESGEGELLVRLEGLANRVPHIQNAEHYINHASFAPQGDWITFFHIWRFRDTGKRGIILYGYDRTTKSLFVIEDQRTPSHFCWQSNTKLLVTNVDTERKWRYSLYDIETVERKDLKIKLNQDGHPMFKPGSERIIVTDTYPDKRRDQHLLMVDIETGQVTEIAAAYSPYAFRGQVRCDLHPRWDRNGKFICVDSLSRGQREMIIFDVENSLINL